MKPAAKPAPAPPLSDGRPRFPLGVFLQALREEEDAQAKRASPKAAPAPVTAKGTPAPDGMNATERRYAERLEAQRREGLIAWWAFERVKIALGPGAWYTPDFALLLADGTLELHETKGGFAREAARVRFKVAAERFPAVFRWCVWEKGAWEISTPYALEAE